MLSLKGAVWLLFFQQTEPSYFATPHHKTFLLNRAPLFRRFQKNIFDLKNCQWRSIRSSTLSQKTRCPFDDHGSRNHKILNDQTDQ